MDGVNLVANMWGCSDGEKLHGTEGCPLNATLDGTVLDPSERPLCDKTIADDGVAKLHIAAASRNRTGRPFFVAVGFRKPHMPWRFPAPWLDVLPPLEQTPTAMHPTLDASVPPIAHHTPDLQEDPFHFPNPNFNLTTAKASRLYYHGAVAWVDSQVGRILDTLDEVGMAAETLVALHSDHGWSLGEHGQWQKFTNWEAGVRVPLMIRAPWLPQSIGVRSRALAELVDMYRTFADLSGAGLPDGEHIDGKSLGDVVRSGGNKTVRPAALSQFARCPKASGNNGDIFGPFSTNQSNFWEANWCELVDRSQIPWMGYSMRTDRWRYTEWAAWDGAHLRPDWSHLAGRELYDHFGDDGTDYDKWENVNLADDPKHAEDVSMLSKQLHDLVMHQD